MKKRRFWIVMGIVVLFIMGGVYGWRWNTLSKHVKLPQSSALPPFEEGELASIIDQLGQGDPGESGFFPINFPHDALSWRLAFIDSAERSIDAQYYFWHSDKAGGLLIDRLLNVADRGVRVRLLIDERKIHQESIAIWSNPEGNPYVNDLFKPKGEMTLEPMVVQLAYGPSGFLKPWPRNSKVEYILGIVSQLNTINCSAIGASPMMGIENKRPVREGDEMCERG